MLQILPVFVEYHEAKLPKLHIDVNQFDYDSDNQSTIQPTASLQEKCCLNEQRTQTNLYLT